MVTLHWHKYSSFVCFCCDAETNFHLLPFSYNTSLQSDVANWSHHSLTSCTVLLSIQKKNWLLKDSKNKNLQQVNLMSTNYSIHILYVVTYAKYRHSDCVRFTFERIPEDDPSRDKKNVGIIYKYLNPLKAEWICFIWGFSAYRTVNTLHFSYKNQSLNIL
jgi:hypothetical protein